MASRPLTITTSIELDAPLERLWPLVSDTDRVNRLIGLPAAEESEMGTDLYRTIYGHYLRFPVTWRESPFEWAFGQWFEITRVFAPPFPVDKLITRTELIPLPGDHTRIDTLVTVVPRNLLGGYPAKLVIEKTMLRDMLRIYTSFGQLVKAAAKVVLPPRRKPDVNNARLAQGAQRLIQAGVQSALIDLLVAHLNSADDPDVLKMRPFALADRWGQPQIETLRMFLHATRAGIVDLEWDVLCPHCRGASERNTSLSKLSSESHCPSCNVDYKVNFDELVELRFSVSPTIRDAIDLSFCMGGPANTRHILLKTWVMARSTRELRLKLPEGAYRIRGHNNPAHVQFQSAVGAAAQRAHIRFTESEIVSDGADLSTGETTLTLENAGDQNILITLEQSAWTQQAASASLVTALDEFRQLFSSEVLAPGLGLAVRNLTFMFSDLKDSTAIYDRIGDSPAYARVRDHFGVMQGIIAHYNGALVKTIGDAVMAVFTLAEDAVQASLDIQHEFTAGEIALGNPSLRVKLGLHRGPCIAVNANDLLDYFGSTVNIAARVQGESVGADIVMTDDMMADPEVQRVLAQASPRMETYERELKGFRQTFRLHRVWVNMNGQEIPQLVADEAA